MKLKLNNGQELEVSFWSFMKCHVLVNLALVGIVYGIMGIFFLVLLMAGL